MDSAGLQRTLEEATKLMEKLTSERESLISKVDFTGVSDDEEDEV